MRALASRVGVEPMSLYNHVANKDDLIDGIVDAIISEIEIPDAGDWAESMRARARSARAVLVRRPWAVPLLDSRENPGPAKLAHNDAVIGILRRAGFTPKLTAQAYMLMDSFIYGFALQEDSFPGEGPEGNDAVAREMVARLDADAYPHIAEMMAAHFEGPRFDLDGLFEFGLGVIIDGLEAARTAR